MINFCMCYNFIVNFEKGLIYSRLKYYWYNIFDDFLQHWLTLIVGFNWPRKLNEILSSK